MSTMMPPTGFNKASCAEEDFDDEDSCLPPSSYLSASTHSGTPSHATSPTHVTTSTTRISMHVTSQSAKSTNSDTAIKTCEQPEHYRKSGSASVAGAISISSRPRKKSSSVSFCDEMDGHMSDILDVRKLVRSAFRHDIKSPTTPQDEMDSYNSSMMVSDINLQQRVYLERTCGSKVPGPFPRLLSIEEELQARVVQLRELGKTWQRRYNHERDEMTKLRDHLVNSQQRCEEIMANVCHSFTSTIDRLRLDVKLEQKTRVELLKEKRTLEHNFKKTLDQHELKRKELKKNMKDVTRGFKQLQKNSKTCETMLKDCKVENEHLQVKIRNCEDEISGFNNRANDQNYQIAEHKAREICYLYLLDIIMNALEQTESEHLAGISDDAPKSSRTNNLPDQTGQCSDIPNLGKYHLKVNDHNPCVMELVEMEKEFTNELTNNSVSEETIEVNNEPNNNIVKEVVTLSHVSPESPGIGRRILLQETRSMHHTDLYGSNLSNNEDNNPRKVNNVNSHLRRRDAFNTGAHQWRRVNSENVKPNRRKRNPLPKRHTVVDGLLYTGIMHEFKEYQNDAQTVDEERSISTDEIKADMILDDRVTSRVNEDLSIITRSEPSLAMKCSSLDITFSTPLLNNQDNPEYIQRKSPVLKSRSEDLDERESVTPGLSPRTVGGDSAFAGLRSRRNGIFGINGDIEVQVKSLKRTKKRELTEKFRKFARELGHHEHDSKTKKKERRGSNC